MRRVIIGCLIFWVVFVAGSVAAVDEAHGAVLGPSTTVDQRVTMIHEGNIYAAPKVVAVTYTQRFPVRVVRIEFSNGGVVLATACRTEDSTNCYWRADRRGNHIGYSFLSMWGKQYRIGERAWS